MATKLPNGKQQFLNPTTGAPLAGGKVWHYVPGTSNLKDTYQNSAGTIANTNPITLDAYGSAVIWGNGAYRQVLYTSSGNQIWDQVTSSGISAVMDPVTSAATLTAAQSAFGISLAMQPVVGAGTLSSAMVNLGISLAMQPVVGAPTLAAARTAMGVASVGLSVYNVQSYGAVGNGVVDDTAAINAAIAACASGVVYFPPGLYLVSSTIFLKPGVSMWGTSRLSSTLLAGDNNLNIFGYVASALTTGFEVRDLGFSNNGFTGCTGIFLEGVDGTKRISIVTLQNLYFSGGANGAYLSFCANVTLFNCFANTSANGFWFSNVADGSLVTCQAQNGVGYGFIVTGGPGAYDEGIRLVNCSTNGQAFGCDVQNQDWGQIDTCSFTTCTGLPLAFTNSNNWRVSNSDIAAAAAVLGCSIDGSCSNIQMMNNFFALNTFGISAGGTRHTFSGNHFVSNSNVDIYLNSCQVVNVSNNTCDSATVPQSVLEAGTANYNLVIGNMVNGTVVTIGAQSAAANNLTY